MDDLERQLSSLALRGPSAGLDRRVMAALAASDDAFVVPASAGLESSGVPPSGGIAPVVPAPAASSFVAPASAGSSRSFSQRPRAGVSWRWAMAAAFLMGVLGFLAGRLSLAPSSSPANLAAAPSVTAPAITAPGAVAHASPAAGAPPAVTVQVIYAGDAPNPFDCTVAADDGLRPVQGIQIIPNNGV